MEKDQRLRAMVGAFKRIGWSATRAKAKGITVFALTDSAVAQLTPELDAAIRRSADPSVLIPLFNHLVADELITLGGMRQTATVVTRDGQQLRLSRDGSTLLINGKAKVLAELSFDGGNVLIVDGPLCPATADALATLAVTGEHDDFLKVAALGSLDRTLAAAAPFTLFAPTDDALRGLPQEARAEIFSDQPSETRDRFLRGLVIPSRKYLFDASGGMTLRSLAGLERRLTTLFNPKRLLLDYAEVGATDIDAADGVVHVLRSLPTPAIPQAK